jgi:hypothetical protein
VEHYGCTSTALGEPTFAADSPLATKFLLDNPRPVVGVDEIGMLVEIGVEIGIPVVIEILVEIQILIARSWPGRVRGRDRNPRGPESGS